MHFTAVLFPLLSLAFANPIANPEPFPEDLTAARVAASGDVVAQAVCSTTTTALAWDSTNSTTGAFRAAYAPGTKVTVSCFSPGLTIQGNYWWDKTAEGYYIPEIYLETACAWSLNGC